MKLPISPLTAALCLIISAISASTQTVQSAPVPISSVPFAITAPGTYVLTGNLTTGQVGSIYQAILIATNIQGPVVLDLKGFTLTGQNLPAIQIGGGSSPNTFPITIKNGSISGPVSNSPGGIQFLATEITIKDITFLNQSSIQFFEVSNSTVKNCVFEGGNVSDVGSPGGNVYINLKFINSNGALAITAATNAEGGTIPLTLTIDHCEVALPAN